VGIRLVGDEVLVTSLVGDLVPLVARGVVALGTGNLGEGQSSEWTIEVCGFLRSGLDGAASQDTDTGDVESFSLSATKIRGWTTEAGPIEGLLGQDSAGPPAFH